MVAPDAVAQGLAVLGFLHVEVAKTVQPAREALRKAGRHVLRHEDRGWDRGWKISLSAAKSFGMTVDKNELNRRGQLFQGCAL